MAWINAQLYESRMRKRIVILTILVFAAMC
jgi:hypothetical protein